MSKRHKILILSVSNMHQNTPSRFHRITVFGGSCSGKSTLANKLGAIFQTKVIHIDDHFWQPNWVKPDREEFRAEIKEELASDYWVIDGNYSKVRDLVLERATLAIILDFPLPVAIWRVFARTLSRNSRIKFHEPIPLPKHIIASGIRESGLEAICELSKYTIKFKREKRPGILREVQEALGANYLLFYNQKPLDVFLEKLKEKVKQIT